MRSKTIWKPLVSLPLFLLPLCCSDLPDHASIALMTGPSGRPVVQTAQEVVNSKPGLPIQIVMDTTTVEVDPESELSRALGFVQDESIVGVVGPAGSRAALVVAPLFNEAEILEVVPTGTSRQLADAGPYTFILAANDSVEGAMIGQYVADSLRARTVTLFYITDEYGYGLRDGVLLSLQERGVEVLDAVPLTPRYQLPKARDADMESVALAALEKGNPEAVILAVRDFSVRFLVPFLMEVLPDLNFVAGDGVLLRGENREAMEPYLDRIYQTVFWNPRSQDAAAQAFIREYGRHKGAAPGHDDALFYDGLLLLAQAAREAGPRPDRMREYLLSLGDSRPPFQGVTGPISFGEDRVLPVFIIRSDRLPDR